MGISSLLDPSSGAAIEVRTILELLLEKGINVSSFSTTRTDHVVSTENEYNLTAMGFSSPEKKFDIWHVLESGICHVVFPTPVHTTISGSIPFLESLLAAAERFIDSFNPDVVLIYGDDKFSEKLKHELIKRNIIVIFYLANPTYMEKKTFDNCHEIWTDTIATKGLYSKRFGIEINVIGKFIHPCEDKTSTGRRDMITFVNPAPEKGVTLFYRIAELTAQIMPGINFLVVESRSTLAYAEERSGIPFSRMPHVRRIGLQPNLNAVLARTKILLFPSLLPESGGRTALEACALGIPVVASNRGGLPEVLDDAGILITPPPPLWNKHWLIPPLSEAVPWVEALRLLMTQPKIYSIFQSRALKRWKKFDQESQIDRLVIHLKMLTGSRRTPL